MSASPSSAAARPASSWPPSCTIRPRALRHYGLEVFDEQRLEVTLIEAGPRILPALARAARRGGARASSRRSACASSPARRWSQATAEAIVLGSGEQIERRPEGVGGRRARRRRSARAGRAGDQPRPTSSSSRPTLQTTSDERIFAIGDCASCLLPGCRAAGAAARAGRAPDGAPGVRQPRAADGGQAAQAISSTRITARSSR